MYCGKGFTAKYGIVDGVQRYKCNICGRQFRGGERLNNDNLWKEYVEGKQTYKQLAVKYGYSIRQIQRKIDAYTISQEHPLSREIIVLMDTTYWGRGFGVMLFKDAKTNENLLKYYVKTETNIRYIEGVNELKEKGFVILGVVCDGRKALFTAFGDIPVQMCQFHQKAIIRRYLTKKPKMEVAKELLKVLDLLTITDKESFVGALNLWYEKWKGMLNERTKSPNTKRTTYTHPKLRSAYKSLKNNLPWLFTWYDNYELGIPNTTNALEGHFSDLKNKLRNHNGLALDRKKKFIDAFLKV